MLDCFMFLESPTTLPASGEFEVRGWVISTAHVASCVVVGAPDMPLSPFPRPDVGELHPRHAFAGGFKGMVRRERMRDPWLEIRMERKGASVATALFPFPMKDSERRAVKEKKLARLADRLACPSCGARLPFAGAGAKSIECNRCGRSFPRTGSRLDFLPADLREAFRIRSTLNVSSNVYDEVAQSLIGRCREGLVLDCGAGSRALEYPNVVNYEIVDYPSTDVLGVNERLPFADETFDAVLSLAVLEHVKDPFQSAREITRVLKRGGELYCVVPFLQPMHGYPHHYYNMTTSGLVNLFDGALSIEERRVLDSGLPIWTLTWFLRSWVDGLSGAARERFLGARVQDLIGEPVAYLQQDYVRGLSEEKNFELASSTMIMARKP